MSYASPGAASLSIIRNGGHFSYYNVRYGLQLLPATCCLRGAGMRIPSPTSSATRYVVAAAALVIAAKLLLGLENHANLPAGGPNQRQGTHGAGGAACGNDASPSASATFLMNCGAHPGATQMAAIRLRRVSVLKAVLATGRLH